MRRSTWGARRSAALSAHSDPKEKPDRTKGPPGWRALSQAAAATRSSVSPAPPSYSPAEAPTPRKLKRSAASENRFDRRRAARCTTFVRIVPPSRGCGCATSAAPAGTAGERRRASRGPAGAGISSEESLTGGASGIETTLTCDLFSDAAVEFLHPGRL